ncbi:MAG: hypothetical protein CUN55_04755 [Phototrophicales bacterium]|nr:MAG: hypothetical protein CUN55_04755 [Phototrophicales bacterium]
MKSDFVLAFNEIVEARSLPKEVVIEAIEQALVSAYRRDANLSSSQQKIEAHIDAAGVPQILLEKEVVESITDSNTEVLLEEARQLYPEAKVGDMVMMPVQTTGRNFGRIAAQTAKQVILQRIREAERETLYEEFIEREGDLVTGTVQSVSPASITLTLLGRAEAIMPRAHQIPRERYKQHDKVRVYVVEVNKSTRGPQILVSRAHKDMLRRLFEYEVPEVYNGQVEIKSIAREPGYRSKVAVHALQEGIDPVGACVGMRGMRIQNIISELSGEKIDVIEWDPDPRRFIEKALSPARVAGVFLHEEVDQIRTATVIVPEDQLSQAIGREGQNARLAAKLTGWRIDIKSVTETARENLANIEQPPLSRLLQDSPKLVEEAKRILAKKDEDRAVMPEEYSTLTEFALLSEELKTTHLSRAAEERLAMLEAVRPLVPSAAFEMPIESLELADDIVRALGRIDNVGELMIRVLADEDYLAAVLKANNAGDDALEAIKYALDDLVLPEIMETDEAEPESDVEADVEVQAEAEIADVAPVETEDVEVEDADIESFIDDSELETLPPAFPEEPFEADIADKKSKKKQKSRKPVVPEYDELDEDLWLEEDDEELDSRKGKKKGGKSKKRHLVYDEDLGEMIAKRRRKGSRRRRDDMGFDDFD